MSRFRPTCLAFTGLLNLAWVLCTLAAFSCVSFGAEPGTPLLPVGGGDATNAQDTLRSWLQVQEQLHATQLAIERNRQESDAAAARSAEVMGSRLQGIEQALATQRAQELEAMQSSNRVMLLVAGSFAVLGVVAMLLTAYFQWRTVSRLAEISASLPFGHAIGAGHVVNALGTGDGHQLAIGPAQESNQRLLGVLDRLEKRILELEHTSRLPMEHGAPATQAPTLLPPNSGGDTAGASTGGTAAAPDAARITMLLGKGQSLLNLDKAEDALACFDEVLANDSKHADALVKKGTALERLRRLDEAMTCYDRAIAADASLTVGYLCKAGLLNRMERFNEALECYEKALHTQETRRG